MQRGEHGRGELAGVCGRDELAAVAHALQAGPDGCFPAAASCRDVVPGHVVQLGEFAAERSERAAALAARVSWIETILSRHARRPSIPLTASSIGSWISPTTVWAR